MKRLLDRDTIITGVVATLVSELLCALLLWGGLLLFRQPVAEHLRWFAVAFVPPLLLLRHYAQAKEYPTALRATIITLFLTFILFMWYLLRFHYLSF